MSKELSVRPYILKFSGVYLIGIIILITGFVVFDLSYSAYASIIVLLGAVLYTTSEFIQDTGRTPVKNEKTKLIWLSFLMSWLMLLLLIVAGILLLGGQQGITDFGNVLSQIGATKLIGGVSVVSLVYLTVMFLGYGKIAKMQYKILRKNGMM
ncbi:MAG: ABZJ_00895 family protein [Nitrosomonas sp.]|nr:ABZJ_00895 family protein [Nitrosomonas sp.]